MRIRFGGAWVASVFTFAALTALPNSDSETQTAERLTAALEGLKMAAAHERMPDKLRESAQHWINWLTPRLLTTDQKWTDEHGRTAKRGEPPPAAYVESLELDLKTIQAALVDTDSRQREDAASRVVQDLKLKSEDCLKFGRGRLVQVEVSTVKGDQVVNNWQVYYKYVAVGDMPTAKLPMESRSSPARKSLPPGQYDFHAEAAEGGSFVQSTVVRCAVGGVPVVRLEIPILH